MDRFGTCFANARRQRDSRFGSGGWPGFAGIPDTALTGHPPFHMMPTVMASPDKTGFHTRGKMRLGICFPRNGRVLCAGSATADS